MPATTEPTIEFPGDEPTLSEEDGIRYLHFGSEWIQGAMRVGHPSELVLAYAQQMMIWLLFLKPGARERIGVLGLGAGSLLRFALRHTRAQVDTVERNPQVTAMCRAFFRLPGSRRSTIDHADARDWVADPRRAARYRVLLVDLYDSRAQGPVCSEPSFYRDCHRILAEGGVMAVNLFGAHDSFDHNLQGIQAAFAGQVLCLPEIDEGNTVVLAFKGPLPEMSRLELLDRAQELERRSGLPARRLVRSWLGARPGYARIAMSRPAGV